MGEPSSFSFKTTATTVVAAVNFLMFLDSHATASVLSFVSSQHKTKCDHNEARQLDGLTCEPIARWRWLVVVNRSKPPWAPAPSVRRMHLSLPAWPLFVFRCDSITRLRLI